MVTVTQLREFIRYAWERAPAVRAQLNSVGMTPEDFKNLDDLVKIPVLPKKKLMELQRDHPPFGGWNAVSVGEMQRIFTSPGPIYDPQGAGEDFWRWAPALREAGFGPGDLVLNTFSYHLTPAGFMFDSALRSLECVVIPAGVGNVEIQVEMMKSLGATGFTGVPSFLMALIKKAEEKGYQFREEFNLRKAFVTAEKLPETMRTHLAQDYGIEVFQGYGTADAGCIAYECTERKGMHVGKEVVVEIVNPDTGDPVPPGETGEVVVTLLNKTYPLVRFGTGDLASLLTGSCPCGKETPRLSGIFGRVDEAVKVRGLFVHAQQIKKIFDDFPEIKRYQGRVNRSGYRDELELWVEPAQTDTFNSGLVARIKDRAREILRLRVLVRQVAPGTIKEESVLIDRRKWD
ncbi:phenylacetate--CoA ligase family protein [Calderihabitans maritimus]|uniref:Putative phenylacetate-coenzyme A ligase n=1 Tax=Calderihabitans maritimus TaxID=1246530 RepID=A0A1Z5HT12_9FIRM|nr:AMP-binding protein [Calderihabitans maritimus]GAW92673.1 putative phenylacetate-coenzyme A ligase [Calderihabitans maritimus]